MKKIFLSLITIGLVGGGALATTGAFFADTESSVGNTFAAGAIDLKIDNDSWYNGVFQPDLSWELKDLEDELFFDFHDLKPGDWEEDTISLHIENNDAWACSNLTLTEAADNGITEPEGADGDVTNGKWAGELDKELHFAFWADDGDNVLEDGEQIVLQGTPADLPQGDANIGATFAIADSTGNIFGAGPLEGDTTHYIGKAFCFGNMTPAPLAQDGVGNVRTPGDLAGPGFGCNGSLVNNVSQTDSIKGNISFYAVQSRGNGDFVCKPDIFRPSPTPTPIACVPVYGNSVVEANPGTLKNGSPITDPNRTDPTKTLGAADNQFWSIGKGGNITLKFASPVSDVSGYDLTLNVHEITNSRDVYPEERADVFVSSDGATFFLAGFASSEPGGGGDGISLIDFGATTPLDSIQYVKLVDTTNFTPHEAIADGYDLDAVRGNCKAE